MQSFKHLHVWQKEIALIKCVYLLTGHLPAAEQFGLVFQLRRSVVSIFANTVEGLSRVTTKDKSHRYIIARAECSEAHALMIVCMELGFLSAQQTQDCFGLLEEVGRLLSAYINAQASTK